MALPRRTAANDYESRSPGVSHKDTTGASTIKSLLLGLLLGFDTSQSIGRGLFGLGGVMLVVTGLSGS